VAISHANQVKIIDDKKTVSCFMHGWELCYEWKDGSTSWQKFPNPKKSHPLQVAKFVFAAQIANVPAFNWQGGWVLEMRDQIIFLGKPKVLNTTSLPILWA
jgi:hypothetical protein